jgi:hypothetical protein
MHMLRLALAATVALTALTTTAGAQAGAPSTDGQFRSVLSVNPIALPFGWLSAEYERVASPAFTLGLGGAYVNDAAFEDDDFDDARDAWIHARVRYFPNERAPRGFSIGLTAGYHSARGRGDFADVTDPLRTEGAPTLGVVLDYDWLLGRRRRFAVGTGIGVRRVLTNVDTDVSPLEQVYPDGRLQIGFAF